MNGGRGLSDADLRIETERLSLRSPAPGDEDAIVSICNHRDVYQNTLTIPHPYGHSNAAWWIGKVTDARKAGTEYVFLSRLLDGGDPVGTVGLGLTPEHGRAELGYVVAPPHRGKGFATESARALVRFGFETLGLEKITACWYAHNPASESILKKVGMTKEGLLRRHFRKGEDYLDTIVMSILRAEYEKRS